MTRQTLNVPPFGAYCVDGLTANPDGSITANGATIGACSVEAPPANDPTALTTAQLLFLQGDSRAVVLNNADMRTALTFLGRGNALQSPASLPGRTSCFQFQLPRGRGVRARLPIPGDMAAFIGILKAVSYADPNHPLPRGWQQNRFKVAIVPAGADWSAAAADAGAMNVNQPFSDQSVLQIGVGQITSSARAELARGVAYDLLLAWMDPTYGGGMVLQWNPSFQGR